MAQRALQALALTAWRHGGDGHDPALGAWPGGHGGASEPPAADGDPAAPPGAAWRARERALVARARALEAAGGDAGEVEAAWAAVGEGARGRLVAALADTDLASLVGLSRAGGAGGAGGSDPAEAASLAAAAHVEWLRGGGFAGPARLSPESVAETQRDFDARRDAALSEARRARPGAPAAAPAPDLPPPPEPYLPECAPLEDRLAQLRRLAAPEDICGPGATPVRTPDGVEGAAYLGGVLRALLKGGGAAEPVDHAARCETLVASADGLRVLRGDRGAEPRWDPRDGQVGGDGPWSGGRAPTRWARDGTPA